MDIDKLMREKSYLLYIFHSLYFNLKMLPFKQAIKLPILLSKPHFISLKGKIILEMENVSFGVVKLGGWGVRAFPNTGIKLNLLGGTWTIKGKTWIGSNSCIEIGKQGWLTMDGGNLASTSLKVFCYRSIEIGKDNRFGWNVTVMDTNFHPLKKKETGEKKSAGAPIVIGDNNWFATNCVVMPGVQTPKRCIFGYGSMITRNTEFEEYAVHAGTPLHVVSRGFYRDVEDDKDPAVYM